ncbi:MAG: hypothetical protein OXM62_06455 [bacterium]|nr:hypothetical protein [bacterium]
MTSAVRVVPAVAAFDVDQGFWYSVPAHLSGRIGLGAKVRAPLGGTHVHGYVVECGDRSPHKLKPVSAVSGDLPVFDGPLLAVCRWAAHHYVTPLSTILARTAPPNAPRTAPGGREDAVLSPSLGGDHPAARLGEDVAAGRRRRPGCLLINPSDPEWVGPLLGPALGAGRSVMVVVPTALEEERTTHLIQETFPGRVLGASTRHSDRQKTMVWGQLATRGGMALVGTPGVAFWPMADPGLVVVVEDGRRAHKSRRAPTVGTQRILRERSIREGAVLASVGPMPSVDVLALGPDFFYSRGRRRLWSHIEVVNRREAGNHGLFHPRTLAALRAVTSGNGAFVFAHRRGFAPAMRCGACRTLRRCRSCGGRAEKGPACQRCGKELGVCRKCGRNYFEPLGAGVERVRGELRRRLGESRVGVVGGPAPIAVGTEASLAGAGHFQLVVVVDADGLLHAPHYRAEEEALRVMVRLAGHLSPGSGRRLMVQTSSPGHRVLSALRKGESVAFLQEELDRRVEAGFPPQGQLMAVEARGADPGRASDRLAMEMSGLGTRGVSVHGPAEFGSGLRWLVEGGNLWAAKEEMRIVASRWRKRGLAVRIDADPIDL